MIKAMRLTVGMQWDTSRNMGESFSLRVARLFWSIVYLTRGLIVGLKGMRTQSIGETVYYKGEKWFVSNWAGSAFVSIARDGGYLANIPQSELTPCRHPREKLHRFNTAFWWYMTSWHPIDVSNRLYK